MNHTFSCSSVSIAMISVSRSPMLGLVLCVASTLAMDARAGESSSAPPPHLPSPPHADLPRAQCFDYQVKDKSVYADKYYFIWGARSHEQPGPVVASCYFPIGRDTGMHRDLKWWKANHPDWIVYQRDRVTPAWGFTYTSRECVPLDYGNPEMREWYFATLVLPAVEAGWKVIGFDNCSGTSSNWDKRSGHYDREGNWIELYPDDPKDQRSAEDLIAWLRYLSKRLHSMGVGMAANIGLQRPTRNPDALRRAIDAVDIVVDEAGFTWHRDANVGDSLWEDKVALLRHVLPTKRYMCINTTTGPAKPAGKMHQDIEASRYRGCLATASHEQVAYAIGSFLIVREPGSMICLCGVNEYGTYLDRPELNVAIGSPVAAPSRLPCGVWVRQYTGGLVLVNPSSQSPGAVELPSGGWQDFGAGAELKQAVTLPPNRAMVLLPATH
jgi:hypothetical protein